MSLTIGALNARTPSPQETGAASPGAAAPDGKQAVADTQAGGSDSVALSPEALAMIARLKARDTQVRQHEQAHLAAAGGLATSGASYTYQRGPDGVNYAVGGEVRIDTGPGRTPEDTIARAQAIIGAALAPADPSGADRAIAAQAQQMAAQARAQLQQGQAASVPASRRGASDDGSQANLAVRRGYGQATEPGATIDVRA